MTELDLAFVRSQFPAFDEPTLAGWGFFENAGGSYPCADVIARLATFYERTKVQPYGPYPASRKAGEQMDEARDRLATILCVAPDEIAFGPSTTQNVYVLSHAFREIMAPGDAVIVTDQDHEANTGAWRRLADAGIEIREWRVDPETGMLDPADLDALLDGKVRVLAFPHCSNIIGALNPVAEICAKARAAGAATVVDGVSAAPHGFPDITALGADIYLFSAYKTFGPHQGVMTVRGELNDRLAPQCHGFNAGARAKRLTPAGPDHAQIAALCGVADYFDRLHSAHYTSNAPQAKKTARVAALMRGWEKRALAPLLEHVAARSDVRLLGPADPEIRVPTVSLVCAEPGAEVARKLASHRIAAGGGDFYAPRVLRAMGVEPDHGVLRLSFTHYTSEDEVARLIEALDAVL